MKIIAITQFIILLAIISKGQGKVEISIGGEIQKLGNEAIRVHTDNSRIEIRIYPADQQNLASIVDSLSTVGCGVALYEKNRIKIFRPKTQQQQQRSSSRIVQEKFSVNKSFRPLINGTYVSFSFLLSDVTACKGRNVIMALRFNSQKSRLDRCIGYKPEYKLYYVL